MPLRTALWRTIFVSQDLFSKTPFQSNNANHPSAGDAVQIGANGFELDNLHFRVTCGTQTMSTATTSLSAEAAANLPRPIEVIMNGNGRWIANPRLRAGGGRRNFGA